MSRPTKKGGGSAAGPGRPVGRERRIQYSDELIWGVHPVMEVLQSDAGRIQELILQKDKRGSAWEKLVASARESGVKCSFVEKLRITGCQSGQVRDQGVVARCAAATLTPFDQILQTFSARKAAGGLPRVLVCDAIQDPHNLGALIRSAHGAGIDEVIVPRERSAPLSGTAAKASAGALSRVRVCQVTNLVRAIEALKEAGAWVFGAVRDEAARSIYDTDFLVPSCLVIGNEGQGIRPLVRRHCDLLVSIPMSGGLESLNSSVAGAVIMFEIRRQELHAAGDTAS